MSIQQLKSSDYNTAFKRNHQNDRKYRKTLLPFTISTLVLSGGASTINSNFSDVYCLNEKPAIVMKAFPEGKIPSEKKENNSNSTLPLKWCFALSFALAVSALAHEMYDNINKERKIFELTVKSDKKSTQNGVLQKRINELTTTNKDLLKKMRDKIAELKLENISLKKENKQLSHENDALRNKIARNN